MEQLSLIIIVVALLAIFFGMGVAERRRYLKRVEQELKERYGKRQDKKIPSSRFECIPAYFRKHASDTAIDDITWSSAHGILQARILECVAICSSGDFPDPGI